MTDLDDRLLAAHAQNAATDLVDLYQEAAEGASDDAARSFFLTQAYVFALETAHVDAAHLRAALAEMGSEPADQRAPDAT
ncbi:hypothetical protein [uncultured Tateyamaria sp.]|uniref:hypothetical protein n=1 Tax=uncultured Tateyamaria sp. TaxID=455651 RepID=UPI0026218D9F|nr:hypothetical protein [uncultured Tateyamaria sp.]